MPAVFKSSFSHIRDMSEFRAFLITKLLFLLLSLLFILDFTTATIPSLILLPLNLIVSSANAHAVPSTSKFSHVYCSEILIFTGSKIDEHIQFKVLSPTKFSKVINSSTFQPFSSTRSSSAVTFLLIFSASHLHLIKRLLFFLLCSYPIEFCA
jgi:hypothetical protein